jgi:hypothetical protein
VSRVAGELRWCDGDRWALRFGGHLVQSAVRRGAPLGQTWCGSVISIVEHVACGWWLFGIHAGRWRATGSASGACVRAEGVESVSHGVRV